MVLGVDSDRCFMTYRCFVFRVFFLRQDASKSGVRGPHLQTELLIRDPVVYPWFFICIFFFLNDDDDDGDDVGLTCLGSRFRSFNLAS